MKKYLAGFVNSSAFGLALLTFGASASAATISFNTNAAGTAFASGSLTLASNGGAAATLVFTPRASSTTGTPSNVNYGFFTLLCPSCTTQANAGGAFFNPFTFNLVITDETDGGVGRFVGSSAGGTIFRDVSPINITFVPLILGPGTTNAQSGTFGPTSFRLLGDTSIVAPNSGNFPGQTTVEGRVESLLDSRVPEPGTMALFGAGLLCFSMLMRRN